MPPVFSVCLQLLSNSSPEILHGTLHVPTIPKNKIKPLTFQQTALVASFVVLFCLP